MSVQSDKSVGTVRENALGEAANAKKDRTHYAEAMHQFQRGYWLALLQVMGWRVSDVAEFAGVDRCHIYRRLRALGLFKGRAT